MKWWQACIKSSGWLGFCRFHQIPKGASNPKRLGAHSYWHWRCLGLKSPLRPFPIFWKTTGYFGVRPKSNLHYSVIAITSEVFEQIFPDYMYVALLLLHGFSGSQWAFLTAGSVATDHLQSKTQHACWYIRSYNFEIGLYMLSQRVLVIGVLRPIQYSSSFKWAFQARPRAQRQ